MKIYMAFPITQGALNYLLVEFKPEGFGVSHEKRGTRLDKSDISAAQINHPVVAEHVRDAAGQRRVMSLLNTTNTHTDTQPYTQLLHCPLEVLRLCAI